MKPVAMDPPWFPENPAALYTSLFAAALRALFVHSETRAWVPVLRRELRRDNFGRLGRSTVLIEVVAFEFHR